MGKGPEQPFTKEGTQLSKKPYGKTQMKISVPQHVTYQIGNNLKTVKDWEQTFLSYPYRGLNC